VTRLFTKVICRSICEDLESKSKCYEYNQHIDGKKCCRRFENFLHYIGGLFYPCCGMQLRRTPTSKNDKRELGKKEKVNRKLEYWHRDELALRLDCIVIP